VLRCSRALGSRSTKPNLGLLVGQAASVAGRNHGQVTLINGSTSGANSCIPRFHGCRRHRAIRMAVTKPDLDWGASPIAGHLCARQDVPRYAAKPLSRRCSPPETDQSTAAMDGQTQTVTRPASWHATREGPDNERPTDRRLSSSLDGRECCTTMSASLLCSVGHARRLHVEGTHRRIL
jgi:hypothetical protein